MSLPVEILGRSTPCINLKGTKPSSATFSRPVITALSNWASLICSTVIPNSSACFCITSLIITGVGAAKVTAPSKVPTALTLASGDCIILPDSQEPPACRDIRYPFSLTFSPINPGISSQGTCVTSLPYLEYSDLYPLTLSSACASKSAPHF